MRRAIALLAAMLMLGLAAVPEAARAQSFDQLVEQARQAARKDRNKEAAELFARAIEARPVDRASLLREYADQLTYSGQSAEAVLLYREVLSAGPADGERQRAERGLALALLWSGEAEEAASAWQRILDAAPDDADARKNLREALAGAARAAASRNENARAASFFARAAEIDPARRGEILREYADQLTFAGRSAEAVPLYRELLSAKDLSVQDERQARRGLALAYLWSSRYAEAITGWRAVLRVDPKDQDARKNLSNALVGAAREAASFDRNAESASLFAEAIRVSPGRRLELAVEYANQLTYSDRAAKAVPIYREALQSGRLKGDQRRSAMLGLALALKWSGQPEDAIDVYSDLLAEAPDTVEALVGRGSALTQLDRNREALADYDRAAELSPENREAIRDGAQSLSFLGRQRMALERLRPLLDGDADRQTRLIAARAELWKGRPDNAMALVRDMLAANPEDSDALRIEGEIAQARRPLSEVDGFVSTQNDGLVTSGGRLRHGVSVNEGLGVIGAQFRAAILDPEEGDDVRIAGAGVFGRNRFSDMVELNASLFLNRIETGEETRIEPTYDAWLTLWPSDMLRFDISASRSFFDDVESIEKDIAMETVGLSMDVTPDQDHRFSARGSYGFISDGNRRIFAQAEAERRVLRRSPAVFAGARYTYTSFADPERDNGYFNTAWLHSIEATLRAEWQPAPGWDIGASANAGYEWQPDEAKPIWGGAVSASYAPNDSVAFALDVSHQNSNLSGGSDGFIRTTVSGGLDIRW